MSEHPSTIHEPRIIVFSELDSAVQLQAGDTITEINSDRALNDFELAIAARLSIGSAYPLAGAYLRKPLATQIRPKQFNGLVRASAVVLPVDIPELNKISNLLNHDDFAPNHVIKLLISADLYSLGSLKGQVTRDVVYAKLFGNSNSTTRLLGQSTSLQGLSEEAERLKLDSAERARRLSAYAMSHALRGGLPGHGKNFR